MTTRRSAWRLLRLAAGALTFGVAGCSETPTQILIEVDGNLSSSQVARIDFKLTRDSGSDETSWSCQPGFPYSFAANPPAGQSGGEVRLHGTAISPTGEVLLEADARGAFRKNRLLFMPIRFDQECIGVTCKSGHSCVAGDCVEVGAAPLTEIAAAPKLPSSNQCGDFELAGDAGAGGTKTQTTPGGAGGSAGVASMAGIGGMNTSGTGTAGKGGEGANAGGGTDPGGTGGTGGSAGSGGNPGDGVIFEEGFEADEPLAAWEKEGTLCSVDDRTRAESSTERRHSGKKSLKITVDTDHNPNEGVEYTLVKSIPHDAAYYSAWFYVVGQPERHPIYGYFAFFDFFAAESPGAPCRALELWNLNLGAHSTHTLSPYVWFGNEPFVNKEVYADSEFLTNDWVHIEVRLDYYGPKGRQYELWQDGKLMFTIDDLGVATQEPILWRIGLSANWLTPASATIFIDDVKISKKPVGHTE